VTFAGVSLLLATSAVLACYLPRGGRPGSIRWWRLDTSEINEHTIKDLRLRMRGLLSNRPSR